jgi:hypothetical protein
MYPWRQHQWPFSFVFGNEIDGHQQTREERDGKLNGYLYIQYTGVVTKDNYPVATHASCSSAGADCFVGWKVAGIPSSAKLVRQPMHDHAVFLIERAEIPQPGSYAHFHWTGMDMPKPYQMVDGYLLELTAMNSFCFIHHDVGMAMGAKSCRESGGVKSIAASMSRLTSTSSPTTPTECERCAIGPRQLLGHNGSYLGALPKRPPSRHRAAHVRIGVRAET